MKILVLGAGSLGSVFGGIPAKNGHQVTLFGRERCINPVNNHGLFDNAGIPSAATEDIQKALWGKMLYNGTLNALSCLLEINYGKLMENAHTKFVMQDIIREFFALTQKKGLEIGWNDAEE